MDPVSILTRFNSFRSKTGKLLLCALAVLLLPACQGKSTLPQPEFPLGEEAVSAALSEQGLDWTVDQTQPNPSDDVLTLGLLRPESGKAYGDLILTTGDTQDQGRYLNLKLLISKDDLLQSSEEAHSWEEWEDLLLLAARLYGGFERVEELYTACADTQLPLDSSILFEGQLTGGYCRLSVSSPIEEWSPYNSGARLYRLSIDLCASADVLV